MIERLSLIVVVLAALCFGLSPCLAQTQSELIRKTGEMVKPGMRFVEAISELETTGYRCGKSQIAGDDPRAAFCSRKRSYRAFATCIDTVLLWPADDGSRLERLEVRGPVCAGL